MFKNISVKKAKIITGIICMFFGIILCIIKLRPIYDVFSFEALINAMVIIALVVLLYMGIYLFIFAKRETREDAISYVQSFLSEDEYRKVNLKLEDNEFIKLSIEESRISYYAKIKSDEEIEISIVKDDKIISTKVIDLFSFKRFFTN